MKRSHLLEKQNLLRWLRVLMIEREYCTWASPYLRWFRKPLGVLVLLGISALLCGLFVAPQGFVVLAAIAAVVAIGCIWPWVGIRGVSCQLRFAATRSEEGKPVEAELVIANRWPWPVWGLAVEGGFAPEGETGEEEAPQLGIAVARIGGWSRGYFNWTFTPSGRGCFPMTAPHLVTEFPFGLWKAKRGIEVLSRLIVWPARFSLPPIALPTGTQSWTGQESECANGTVGHRTSVREYRYGDSMRHIHWAKTALYDKLVSYEREGQAVTEAKIALDTHPSLHRGRGPKSSMEWTVRIAASICDTLLRQGVQVTVEAHQDQFKSQQHENNPAAVLDWFARLRTDSKKQHGQAHRTRVRNCTATLSFHITTDRSPQVTGDSIVIVVDQAANTSTELRKMPQGWIELSQAADIPTQVRRGWQQGLRRRRYAV